MNERIAQRLAELRRAKGYSQEALARELGCKCLRMDTNERNRAARRLYSRLGYREAGILPCRFNGIEGVNLVTLEKSLVDI